MHAAAAFKCRWETNVFPSEPRMVLIKPLYLLLMRYSTVACLSPVATTDRLNLTAKTKKKAV